MAIALRLNGTRQKLPTALTKGKMITIHSSTLDLYSTSTYVHTDNTIINLLDERGSYPLHISVRRRSDWNCVIFTTWTRNTGWAPEQRVHGLKKVFGPDVGSARIDVEDHVEAYQVYVNENFMLDYKKIVGGEAPQYLEYEVAAKGVYASAFADTLTAELRDIPFSSLRPLRPLRKLLLTLQDD